MSLLVIEIVIAILFLFSIFVIGLILAGKVDYERYGVDPFSWKWYVGLSILSIVSIVGVIYLWKLDLSIRDDLPKKWVAVGVEKLPDKDKGFSSKDLMIKHHEQNPYVVYENVKFPKLIREELTYIKKVPLQSSYIKERLKIVLPKNYDIDKE